MSDHRTLLHGTALNVVGLGAGVVAAFGVQILLGRTLPVGGLGLVTVAVQVAFVAAAGSRFGMDMAAVREVAIAQGADATSHVRSLVDRAVGVAFAISVLIAVAIAAASPLLGDNQTTVALAADLDPLRSGGQHLPRRDPRPEVDGPDAVGVLDRPAGGLDRGGRAPPSPWAAAPGPR